MKRIAATLAIFRSCLQVGGALLWLLLVPVGAFADDDVLCDTLRGTVRIAYPLNRSEILPDFANNREELRKLGDLLQRVVSDTTVRVLELQIHGYGSPDGPYLFNEQLSRRRADSLAAYVLRLAPSLSSQVVVRSSAEDWEGLTRLIEAAPAERLPNRSAVLQVLSSSLLPDAKERRLRRLYPADYRYLIDNCMSQLRRADWQLLYASAGSGRSEFWLKPGEDPQDPPINPIEPIRPINPTGSNGQTGSNGLNGLPADSLTPSDPSTPLAPSKPALFVLRTNLLYDLAVLPNIGLEVGMGKHWSLGADWFYTWFSSDHRHRYWQSYGGYLTLRRYFGTLAEVQRFAGHHVGVYGLAMTYDVEWGGRGYQAEKWGFGGGVEYGYSAKLSRRLRLDFTLGMGFQDGEYKEYKPQDTHYVWQSTHKRRWFGPTKAEASLKWLIGKKGDAR